MSYLKRVSPKQATVSPRLTAVIYEKEDSMLIQGVTEC